MYQAGTDTPVVSSHIRPVQLDIPLSDAADYQIWLATKFPSRADIEALRRGVDALAAKPILSIVMPVRDPPARYLAEAIESVRSQIYPHWQLCLADDGSTRSDVRALLAEAAADPRIDLVTLPKSGGIVAASNAALALAQGSFVAFLDHDDLLTPDALYEIARLINEHADADLIYTDEDKIDDEGKLSGPIFKPDWCPDSFLSRMYLCHLCVYRRQLVVALGGLRAEYEGGQAYDLALRVTERAASIHHIPKILYHWRMHAASTATDSGEKLYVYEADKRAIEDALARRGEPARVERVPGELGFYLTRYALKATPRISIIIPSRNHGGMLHRALDSLFSRTDYSNFEVVVVDNGSTEARANEVLADWSRREPKRYRVAPLDIAFNFSTLCNHGVDKASGEVLLFLNNDIEVIDSDWLTAMLEQAQRPSIGAVGARLFYEDGSIQHAGAILGLGGLAAHSHRGAPATSPGYMHQVWTINNYSSVAGACLMCRRAVFEEAGRFDEALPGDYEDVDLCLKLVRRGYRNVYLPHVRLFHYEAATRGRDYVARDPEGRERAMKLMRNRWPEVIAHDPCYSPHLTRDREDYGLRIEGIDSVEARNYQPGLAHFFACVDRTVVIDARTLILSGWAMGRRGEALRRVEVAVDAEASGEAAYGYVRDDVGNVHRAALSANVGFAYSRKFDAPLPPRIAIRVTLHRPDGKAEAFDFTIATKPAAQNAPASWRRRAAEKAMHRVRSVVAAVAVRCLPSHPQFHGLPPERLLGEAAKRMAERFGAHDALRRAGALAPALADRFGLGAPLTDDPSYADWLWREYPNSARLAEMRREVAGLKYQPTISIIMPVYNVEARYLIAAIDSALAQTYPDWELCIADDASPGAHVRPLLEACAARDRRVKLVFRPENGGISAASNSALALACGEFVAQLDHDDLLAPHALQRVVELLNQHGNADVIYSDEDKVDLGRLRSQPFFKPDWSPDTFLTKMYTCHFGVYRRALVEAVGGFRSPFDGAEDYDLVLRLVERTGEIHHIPDILYSWRMHPLSTATGARDVKSYAYDAAVRAIADALRRRGEPGEVLRVPGWLGFHCVRYDLAKPGRVSVILPTRDSPRLLDRCLLSLFERTTYADFEVIVVDSSVGAASRLVMQKWSQREPTRFRSIRSGAPFNHSALVNAGARASSGDYLVFLNDDTEAITPDWLEEMARQAQRPSIGAVGAQLQYRGGDIQHAGIVVGIMGGAGHAERRTPSDRPGYFGRVNTAHNVLAVTGACLMCRRELFDTIGGFDETFDSAYNDVDFCLRLHRLGLRNIYVPQAKLYHLESQSFRLLPEAERTARVRRGAALLRERWPDFLNHDPYYSPHLTRSAESFSIG